MSSSLEVDSDKAFTEEWTTSIQTNSQQLSNLQSDIFITQWSPGGFSPAPSNICGCLSLLRHLNVSRRPGLVMRLKWALSWSAGSSYLLYRHLQSQGQNLTTHKIGHGFICFTLVKFVGRNVKTCFVSYVWSDPWLEGNHNTFSHNVADTWTACKG